MLEFKDFFPALIVSGIFLLIFLFAEAWRFFLKPPVEWTRKFVHLMAGTIALFFTAIFESHWTIMVLCVLFVSIIVVTKKFGWLQSVHDVDRRSDGGIYYPIAIYLTFLFSQLSGQPVFYVISILVLAISDSMAAVIGKSYGLKPYRVEDDYKSLEGTLIFFLTTFLIVHLGLLLFTDLGRLESVLTALYVAILVTGFEMLSLAGADNIFIPLGTLYILNKYPRQTSEEMISQLIILIGVLLVISFIALRSGKFGISAAIGLGLMGYASWGLVNFNWFIPVLIVILLASLSDFILERPTEEERQVRIRAAFYVLGVGVFWIFLVNVDLQREPVYLVPYLFNFISNLNLMWKRKQVQNIVLKNPIQERIRNFSFPYRALVLTAIFIPIQYLLNPSLHLLGAIILCTGGMAFTEWIHVFILKNRGMHLDRLSRFRMGMVITGITSLIIFGISFLLWLPEHPLWRI